MYDLNRKLGEHSDAPIKILANINSKSFGDFISSVFYVNSVADHFDHTILSIVYRDDMDFKAPTVSLLPLAAQIRVPKTDALPSFELINCSSPLQSSGLAGWYQAGYNDQHLLITESMCAAYNLCALDRVRYLSFPEPVARSYEERLLQLGVQPKSWFCTVHCREPGYQGKPSSPNFRDGDPAMFLEATKFVIEKLGGQVVRLGHPGMTPFPKMPGLIDITDQTDPLLQCFAISRSRFLFAAPSGPTAVAEAFGVPMAVLDAVDLWTNGPLTLIQTVNMITPKGELINQQKYADQQLSKRKLLALTASNPGYKVYKNSGDVLLKLVQKMHGMTDGVTKWRAPEGVAASPRPNAFVWPGVLKPKHVFL